jgi:hypothetical protein
MKTIPEMTAEIECLEQLLDKVQADATAESEIRKAAETVFSQCREIRPDSGMLFYVLDDPAVMPSDARVDFLYRPTYLAAAILISIAVRFPEIGEKAPAAFASVLRACTGRGFHGHGYESEQGLVDALAIFLKAPIKRFLEKHADVCPEFSTGFTVAIEELRGICGGTIRPTWGSDDNLVRRAKDLFSIWEKS